MHGIPGAELFYGRYFQLLDHLRSEFPVCHSPHFRRFLAKLFEDSIIDTHKDTSIGLWFFTPIDYTDLAVSKLLAGVKQQPHPALVAFGTKGSLIHGESAPP